ncbi:MAG: hypothetical protein CITR_02948 [Citrobacter freundii]
MNRLAIKNPKRLSDDEVKVNWYNYYAGFSSAFVKDVLHSCALGKSSIVLDPWNGAGTTTTAVNEAGLNAIGIDLNPVMCVVAKAKSASLQDVLKAYEKFKSLRVSVFKIQFSEKDFLLNWFEYETAKYIRYLSITIIGSEFSDLARLNVQRCVMLVALFNVVRDLVQGFVPSNPTWIKKAKTESEKIVADNGAVKKAILEYLVSIKTSINEVKDECEGTLELFVASSKSMPIQSKSVDLVITSPPYCTRIDYGVATYPELSILLGDEPERIDSLRRQLIGRTTIDKNTTDLHFVSEKSIEFMGAVERHDSHASSNYYLKNFRQYFVDMQVSVSEVARVIADNGIFVCVVQDSYYKEIYCDLSGIITEIAVENGFTLEDKKDFQAKNIMANIHSGTKKYRSKVTAIESVLVFKKQG